MKNLIKKLLVYFNLLPAYELVNTNKLLDDWVKQPIIQRKGMTDAEFRERIKQDAI